MKNMKNDLINKEIRGRISLSLFDEVNKIRIELKTTWPKILNIALRLFIHEYKLEGNKDGNK